VIAACHAKIAASEQHLNRLYEATEGFFKDKVEVAPIAGKANSQRTKYFFRVDSVIGFPALEWGIILGDAVHCLRSALDQLVYGFARDPWHNTQFPIFSDGRDWTIKAPAMYWSIPPPLLTIIDKAQPYHLGDTASDHPLALLRKLSNLDKHRAIPAIALVPYYSQISVRSTRGIKRWSRFKAYSGRPFEKGTVIAECKIVADDSGLEPEMDVDVKNTFDVGFGKISENSVLNYAPVIPTIQETIGLFVVNEVVNPVAAWWNKLVIEAERHAGK